MNLLLEHFHLLTGQPEHIAKLKGLILQLAVQGKLVPQDPSDEPASRLLERIHTPNGARKRTSTLTISDKEIPFDLPEGWAWARLSDVTENFGQKQPDKQFTYIDVASIDQSIGVISNETNILMPSEAPSRARKIVKKGCVIYSTIRPYLLNVAVVDKDIEPEAIVSTAFAVMNPLGGITPTYLFYYLRSQPFINYVESRMVGLAYPAINDEKLFKGILPVPPLAEQHRIVARVDELFSQLEALSKVAIQVREGRKQVGQAMLHQLGNAASPGDLERSWSRIARHFGDVFSDGSNVKTLRQTILQLAVQGKLVPQDPTDEPADVLLERIKAEKKLKKEAPLEPITAEEIPYNLPEGWVWCRGEEIADIIDPQPSHRTPSEVFGGIPYIGMGDIEKDGSIDLHNSRKVSEDVLIEHRARYSLRSGDFIFGKIGTVGKPVLLPAPYNYTLSANVILIQPKLNPLYLFYFLTSPIIEALLRNSSRVTTHAAFGIKRARLLPVAVPPLEEQNQIVAKVESLLGLCDQLEVTISQSEEQAGKLLQAVVRDAVNAEKEVQDVV